MTTTIDAPTTVARYFDFWNADAAGRRRRLAATVFASDVAYVAPIGAKHGVDELIGLADDFATDLGDVAFVARSAPEVHHDRVRVRWELLRGDDSFAEGTDILVVDDNGRISSVTTFLDRAPTGFDQHAHA
jgi:hypothetical protein